MSEDLHHFRLSISFYGALILAFRDSGSRGRQKYKFQKSPLGDYSCMWTFVCQLGLLACSCNIDTINVAFI